MREVTVRKGEPIDRALKRLKTKLDVEGILDEMRRRRAFETPMDERRRKARSASKRNKVKCSRGAVGAAAFSCAIRASGKAACAARRSISPSAQSSLAAVRPQPRRSTSCSYSVNKDSSALDSSR